MILNFFPVELIELFRELEKNSFQFTLVGGATRDFLINKQIDKDLDFEVRSQFGTKYNWDQEFSKLIDFLKLNEIKFEELPYKILRFEYFGFSIELTSPRVEKFNKETKHHNFDAIIDPTFTFEESFKRRDFTINAIGFKINFSDKKLEIVDPYNGINDIKDKIIRNITDDFYRDPVRFLRLIRFKNNLSFLIHEELEKNLNQMDLTNLTAHYFLQEFEKTKKSNFCNDFFNLASKNNIRLPEKIKDFKLNSINFPDQIVNIESMLTFLIQNNYNSSQAFSEYISYPKKNFQVLTELIAKTNGVNFDDLFDVSDLKILDLNKLKQDKKVEMLKYLATKTVELKKVYKLIDLKEERLHFLEKLSNFKCVYDGISDSDRSYYKILKFIKDEC